MAVITVSLAEVTEDCPNLTITDNTDYTSNGVYPFAQFRFHQYLAGLPTLNTTFTFDTFVFGDYSFPTVTIDVETDGAGNIINAEAQYLALVDLLNAETPEVSAVFVKPSGTGFRDWYINLFTADADQALLTTSVNSTAGITPVFNTISALAPVSTRNISLISPEGVYLDLGATAQIDELSLTSPSYTIGETFTISFCGEDLVYTVTEDNGAECVAKGISDLINAVTDTSSLYFRYVLAEVRGTSVILTAKEPGVPMNISVVYTGAEAISYNTTTANSPSMSVPDNVVDDFITYEASERGGEYTATLTVVSGCDYNTSTRNFFSWCFDILQFDCCFVEFISKDSCCSKEKDFKTNAAFIQNVIRAISVMREKKYSESDIQKVVNLGHSICTSCGCGCSK